MCRVLCCCAESFSHVLLFAIPWTVAHQVPLSMGILQARILEWVAMQSSSGSFQTRDQTHVSTLQEDSLPSEPSVKPMNTGVDSLFLHQRIFLAQELNQDLLHCRWILYQMSCEMWDWMKLKLKSRLCFFQSRLTAGLNSWDRDHLVHRAWTIYQIALYKKAF